jgi:iron complex transport system substrate-binding protein
MTGRRGMLAGLAATALAAAARPTPTLAHPVTVERCGEPMRFDAAPRRAVVHDLNMTQMVLALGLREHLVGVTGITGWHRPDAAFREALGAIPELAPKYPSLETLLAARADFFFAGWYYGMRPGGDVTPATLSRHGIRTMVLAESCIHIDARRPRATMDLLFGDVLKLGTIFGVEDRAGELVSQWRSRLDAVARGTGPGPGTRVFVYDSGEDRPFTAGRGAMPTALIEAAGARNVMDTLPGSWGTASWEAVAARDPQFLLLLDYPDGAGPEGLLAFLRRHPAMRRTEAVRTGRHLALRYAELTPGPANLDAIEKLARALRERPA